VRARASLARRSATPSPSATGSAVRPLADGFNVVYRSERPRDIYCYTPGILTVSDGRLVATFDLGGEGHARAEGGPSGWNAVWHRQNLRL